MEVGVDLSGSTSGRARASADDRRTAPTRGACPTRRRTDSHARAWAFASAGRPARKRAAHRDSRRAQRTSRARTRRVRWRWVGSWSWALLPPCGLSDGGQDGQVGVHRHRVGDEQLGLLGHTLDHGDDVSVDVHLLPREGHTAAHQRRDEAPIVVVLQQRSLLELGVGHLGAIRIDHIDASQHPLEHVVDGDELRTSLSVGIEHGHDGADASLAIGVVPIALQPAGHVVAARLDTLMPDESEAMIAQALLEEGSERVHVPTVDVGVRQDGGDAGG